MNINLDESKSSESTNTNATHLQEINLFPHEKLQLHMDCLNALGEIVTVDDVDDMGGVVSFFYLFYCVSVFPLSKLS
jgi:hypothetical protein